MGFWGTVAGAIEANRTAGRQAEADAANEYDRLALLRNQQVTQRALAEVQQRQFLADEQQRQSRNAVTAGLMKGTQDVSFAGVPANVAAHIPQLIGGLKPSAIANRDE